MSTAGFGASSRFVNIALVSSFDWCSTRTSHTLTAAELGVIATEPAVLWQLYIAVAVEKKLFEVATMIQEGTQTVK